MRHITRVSVLVVITLFLVTSCDQDSFGLSYRKVAGIYYLNRWEDGKTFYLVEKKSEHGIIDRALEVIGWNDRYVEDSSGGGVINGTVEIIGWNEHYIFAKRHANYRGDPDGWMLINVDMHTIIGPYSDRAMRQLPEAKGMRFWKAAMAWKVLSYRDSQ